MKPMRAALALVGLLSLASPALAQPQWSAVSGAWRTDLSVDRDAANCATSNLQSAPRYSVILLNRPPEQRVVMVLDGIGSPVGNLRRGAPVMLVLGRHSFPMTVGVVRNRGDHYTAAMEVIPDRVEAAAALEMAIRNPEGIIRLPDGGMLPFATAGLTSPDRAECARIALPLNAERGIRSADPQVMRGR